MKGGGGGLKEGDERGGGFEGRLHEGFEPSYRTERLKRIDACQTTHSNFV